MEVLASRPIEDTAATATGEQEDDDTSRVDFVFVPSTELGSALGDDAVDIAELAIRDCILHLRFHTI